MQASDRAKRSLVLLFGACGITLAMGGLSMSRADRTPARAVHPRPLSAKETIVSPNSPRALKDYASLMSRPLFRPLVVSGTAPLSPSRSAKVAVAPPSASSSLSGWSYIGMAQVDGVPIALAENGDFYGYYRVGEALGGVPIQSIRDDALILKSPGGQSVRLPLTDGAAQNMASRAASGASRTGSALSGSGAAESSASGGAFGGSAPRTMSGSFSPSKGFGGGPGFFSKPGMMRGPGSGPSVDSGDAGGDIKPQIFAAPDGGPLMIMPPGAGPGDGTQILMTPEGGVMKTPSGDVIALPPPSESNDDATGGGFTESP
jgi:hypothetical protein